MAIIAGAFSGRRLDPRVIAGRSAAWLLSLAPGCPRVVGAASSDRGAIQSARPFPWEATYPPGISWDIELPRQPLFTLLDGAVARFGKRPCVACLGRVYSYREIGRLVDRAAAGFQRLGVGKGVKVGLLLPNTPYYVVCYYAVLKAGGTIVNHNPLYAAAEIRHQIADADVRILVTTDLAAVYGKLAGLLDDTPVETVVVCPMSDIFRSPSPQLFKVAGRRLVSAVPRDGRHIVFARLIRAGAPLRPVDVDPELDV